MREILFRGKRDDFIQHVRDGEWVYGGFFRIGDKPLIMTSKDEMLRVAPETVGQFTGLTDKNGKKIFEGDIVQEDDVIHNGEIQIKGKVGSISFEKSCFVVLYNDTWDFLQTNAKVVLVIGNIHDNPELLEVGE